MTAAVVLAVVAAVAAPVLVGGFAGERLARVRADLEVRAAHWAEALDLRTPGFASRLFGQGLGRFPDLHFWRSREAARAASYRLASERGNAFLRLGPGAMLYLEQIIDVPSSPLTIEADVRSSGAATSLALTLCRKWVLTSKDCAQAALPVPAGGSGQSAWQRVRVPLALASSTDTGATLGPPWVFSIMTPGGQATVDVDQVGLRSANGEQMLDNGGFERGMDRWFFTTDVDPPWHIHSLPVAVLFDQGWLGVAAWSAWLLAVLLLGARALRAGEPWALAAWCGMLAFLVSGLVNTLIDQPRFLWLLLVIGWLGQWRDERPSVGASVGDTPGFRGYRRR